MRNKLGIKSSLLGAVLGAIIMFSVAAVTTPAEVSLIPLTPKKLLGWWRGGDTNALNCILTFDDKGAKIHTFRADKHLSTVFAWYTIQRDEGIVTLGINGEAIALPDGKLQLKLTRQFDHIIVLREATLQRMPGYPRQKDRPEPRQKDQLK